MRIGMRAIILFTTLLFVSPFSLLANDGNQKLTAVERLFVQKYVKAVNGKDTSQLEQLMHPECRECLNPYEDYVNDQFKQSFKYSIPDTYAATIKPLSDRDKDFFEKVFQLGPKIGLNYPIIPTHRLDISFDENPHSSAGITDFLVQGGDHFYGVYACPTPGWIEAWRKRKGDKQEEAKYHKTVFGLWEEYEKSIPLARRKTFLKDEYGVLYWEAKEDWSYNWRFRTKTNLKSIEIIIVDQEGKEEILVDNKTVNGYFPLEFCFRLNVPKLTGSSTYPNLSIPFGFSQTAAHPKAVASWSNLGGINLIGAVYNKNIYGEDKFTKSGEIILATYKTSDGKKEFMSTIKIKYETR